MADAHETLGKAGPESEHAARNAAQALKSEGQRLAADVSAKANALAAEQKDMASGYLSDISEAVDSFTSTLDQKGHGSIAEYTRVAAEEIRRMSRAIEARDLGDLANEVGAFARRRPAVFYGGALAIGFGLARFLASSKSGRDSGHDSRAPAPHPLTTGAAAPPATYPATSSQGMPSHG